MPPENSRPRVLHITPKLFGDAAAFGGGERYALELARALARHTPTRLVAFGKSPRRETLDGLDVRVERERWRVAGRPHDPLNAAFLRHLLWADVIHCHQFRSTACGLVTLAARLARKRVFVTDHGGGGSNLVRRLRIGRWIDAQLSQSAFASATMSYVGRRVELIYAGVDADRYRPTAPKHPGRVVYLGRILPHKGVEHLIGGLPDGASLLVVGRVMDGDYFGHLKRSAAGRAVEFITSAADDVIIPLLSSAQCLVLPSVYVDLTGRRQELPELLGLVLLEAMACATAVICTRVGGMPEIVLEGETGFVVEPGSPEALGSAISGLIARPDLAERMGQRARQEVLRRFTWDSVARRCLDAYSA